MNDSVRSGALMSFREKLQGAWETSGGLLCVGLDPDPALMPIDDIATFNLAIIDATADLACAYKPNLAFYEALGEPGYAALRATLAAIPPHAVKLADAKRGDVPNTARAYARAIFDELGFDACTVSPYLGYDAIEPWIARADKGAFVLARTSNPGARDFQDLTVETEAGDRMPLYEAVARSARSWDRHANVGLVAGATYPDEMRQLRTICPNMPFLVPGVGAQEGALGEAVRGGLDARGAGLLVNASRAILYASRGSDYAEAARREALRLRLAINEVRDAAMAARPG